MKKFKNTIFIIGIILFFWLFCSFCEINLKNNDINPKYNKYNAFILFTEMVDNK